MGSSWISDCRSTWLVDTSWPSSTSERWTLEGTDNGEGTNDVECPVGNGEGANATNGDGEDTTITSTPNWIGLLTIIGDGEGRGVGVGGGTYILST